jgi:RimJ/RimL family protein N-acetyltransferase
MQGHQPPIVLRRATKADRDLLLSWRNDPQTRASSRSTGVIDLVEHSTWLEAILADPSRLLLIGEQDDVPFGTVRFDPREPAPDVEVSLTIAPDHRGRGLSVPLLLAAESPARAEYGATGFWAFILSANDQSVATFRRAGYLPVEVSAGGTWLLKESPALS